MASNEEDRFGTKFDYDPQWKGPMEINRTTTDRNWLIVFIIYFVIYFACAVYAFLAGDLKKLDSHLGDGGKLCGLDPVVMDKPYVMHLNLRKGALSDYSPRICVSQCPTENFVFDKSQSVDEIKKKLICTADVNVTSIASIDEIELLIADDKCARWYLKSKPIFDNCIAYESWKGHEIETMSDIELYNDKSRILDGRCYLKKLYRISQWVWKPSLVTLFFSAVLTLLFVLILRYCAEPFFYISIFLFVALLSVAIYYLMHQYAKAHDPEMERVILIILIVCVVIVIFIVVSVLCTHKKIHLACLLIEESTKAVLHLPATLAYPWLSSILEIAILTFSIVYLLCLLTITVPIYTVENWKPASGYNGASNYYNYGCYCNGNYYEPGDTCNPDEFNKQCTGTGQDCQWKRCELEGERIPVYLYVIHFINVFGLYWLVSFINGLEFMTLGGTFATWYWTMEKSVVGNYALIRSFGRAVKYHLGTIVLGSLILTIAECVTAAFQQGAQHQGGNATGQFYMGMMYYQSNMIERVMEFLSKNAYIMCAVHGKNFFQSCKSAFNLVMRNFTKVIVVHTVADTLFMVVGLLVVTICIGGLVVYFNHTLLGGSDDEHWIFWVSIIVSFIGVAMISNAFLEVISNAVHTIFLCFIEDTERNDGSASRPYYMNSKLEKLLQR